MARGLLAESFQSSDQRLRGEVSLWLDVVRAVAALLVVIEHLASRLFVGYGELEQPGIAAKALYLLNLLGSPAVVVFFVLSGLLISRSVLGQILRQSWSWKPYLINRLTRLYIVLLPCLFLTILLDLAAARFGTYSLRRLEWNVLLGNLAFLQTIAVKQLGSNGPLWSLANEFWYYIAFPLIAVGVHKRGATRAVAWALASAIVIFIGAQKSTYFLIWLVGTAVLFIPRTVLVDRPLVHLATLTFLSVAVLLRPMLARGRIPYVRDINLFWPDMLIALAAGLFLYCLIHRTKLAPPTGSLRLVATFGANSSFTLYLLHYPLLNCMYFIAKHHSFAELQPGIVGILLEIILVALICAAASALSTVTEARTAPVRTFVGRLLQAPTANSHVR